MKRLPRNAKNAMSLPDSLLAFKKNINKDLKRNASVTKSKLWLINLKPSVTAFLTKNIALPNGSKPIG